MDQSSSYLRGGRKGGAKVVALLSVAVLTLGTVGIPMFQSEAAKANAQLYADSAQTIVASTKIVPYTTSIPTAIAKSAAQAEVFALADAHDLAGPTAPRLVEDYESISWAVRTNPSVQYAKGASYTAKTRLAKYFGAIPESFNSNVAVQTALALTAPNVVSAESTDYFDDPIFDPEIEELEEGTQLPEIEDKPVPKRTVVTRPVTVATAEPFEPETAGSGGGDVARSFTGSFSAYTSLAALTDASPFITADGTTTHFGVVANNCLPFGTRIRLPDLYGDTVFVVHDRMNSRYGCSKVDVWLPTYDEAIQFGVRTSRVEVLK